VNIEGNIQRTICCPSATLEKCKSDARKQHVRPGSTNTTDQGNGAVEKAVDAARKEQKEADEAETVSAVEVARKEQKEADEAEKVSAVEVAMQKQKEICEAEKKAEEWKTFVKGYGLGLQGLQEDGSGKVLQTPNQALSKPSTAVDPEHVWSHVHDLSANTELQEGLTDDKPDGSATAPSLVEIEAADKLKALEKTKTHAAQGDFWKKMTLRTDVQLQGPKMVSKVCRLVSQKSVCQHKGCHWEDGTGCKDATQVQCATKKKILDCLVYKIPSPYNVHYRHKSNLLDLTRKLQIMCGKMVFGEDEVKVSVCKYGYRLGQTCETDEDCPCTMDGHEKIGGYDDHMVAEFNLVTKKKCKKTSDGRWTAQCLKATAVEGCAAKLMRPCSETEMGNIPAMAI